MRALSAAEFLDAWEEGASQSPAQRALTLLALACRETSIEELGQLSIGQRDAQLLALRALTFGPQLATITNCPACAEQLEFQIDGREIGPSANAAGPPLQLVHGEYAVEFRGPTSLDLASLDPGVSLELNRRNLLQRCVIAARRGDREIAAGELPAGVETAIAQRLAETDPHAETQLALACPNCQHAWQTPLDIVSYLWAEIDAWARRLLGEVHILASVYGWPEGDILGLTSWRRRAYLELIEP
jgi:hypothetical protein